MPCGSNTNECDVPSGRTRQTTACSAACGVIGRSGAVWRGRNCSPSSGVSRVVMASRRGCESGSSCPPRWSSSDAATARSGDDNARTARSGPFFRFRTPSASRLGSQKIPLPLHEAQGEHHGVAPRVAGMPVVHLWHEGLHQVVLVAVELGVDGVEGEKAVLGGVLPVANAIGRLPVPLGLLPRLLRGSLDLGGLQSHAELRIHGPLVQASCLSAGGHLVRLLLPAEVGVLLAEAVDAVLEGIGESVVEDVELGLPLLELLVLTLLMLGDPEGVVDLLLALGAVVDRDPQVEDDPAGAHGPLQQAHSMDGEAEPPVGADGVALLDARGTLGRSDEDAGPALEVETDALGEIETNACRLVDRKSTRLNSSHANISYAV